MLSAAKVIQDRHDLDKFDLQGGIDLLNYAEAPAGEDIQLVKAFNRIIRETYKNRDKDHLPDYYTLWTGVGLEGIVAGKVMAQAKTLLSDTKLVSKIESTYARMIACPAFLQEK